MTIIIVGADDIGLHLIDLAARDGIDLVVVEEDSEQAETVRNEYDCTIINDDPASLKTLEKAGGERADALLATTSSDEINITTCLFGQELGIDTTVSVINDAEHSHLFKQFGIHTVENRIDYSQSTSVLMLHIPLSSIGRDSGGTRRF